MGLVTGWVSALCFAAVASTAIKMLAPEGSLGRIYKMITMTFFLCAFAAPILTMKDIIKLDEIKLPEIGEVSDSGLQEEINIQFNSQVNETVLMVCDELLESDGVNIAEVETNMEIDDSGNIFIDSIKVFLDKDSTSKTILVTQKLESAFGVKVIVTTVRN